MMLLEIFFKNIETFNNKDIRQESSKSSKFITNLKRSLVLKVQVNRKIHFEVNMVSMDKFMI